MTPAPASPPPPPLTSMVVTSTTVSQTVLATFLGVETGLNSHVLTGVEVQTGGETDETG